MPHSRSVNCISYDGARALAQCLRNNTTLAQLDLSGNYIHEDGAWAIAKSLDDNTALMWLDIRGNEISNEAMNAMVAKYQGRLVVSSLK